MTSQSKQKKQLSRPLGLMLAVSLLGAVACQTPGNYRSSPRLSLDGTQLSMLEQTGLKKYNVASLKPEQPVPLKTPERDGRLKESNGTLRNQLGQPSARPLVAKTQPNQNSSVQGEFEKPTGNSVQKTGLENSANLTEFKSNVALSNSQLTLSTEDDEDDSTALVEESEIDTDKEILDADSARSPEEVAELLQNSGIEGNFALCEGSVYMEEWRRIFDGQFISKNRNHYKSNSKLKTALDSARSEEYTKLLLPTLSNFEFDYPVVINEDVIKWIQYFQTRGRKAFVTWLKRAEDVIPQAVPVLEKFGLPKDLIYLAMIESGFNNKATSIARAAGTWQFMRATGRNFGLKLNDYVDERRDPEKASVAAARYLTYLYTLFGDWHLATASYNAGEGRVSRSMRGYSDKTFFALSAAKRLPNETRNYVPKLMAAMIISKNPTRFGFEVSEGSRALRTRGLALEKSIRLADLASNIDVDLKVLESINPELRLGVTPPGQEKAPYILRVPESSYATAIAAVDSLPQASRTVQVSARVKRKETVNQFASRYGISLATLLKVNPHIRPNVRLSKGQQVIIPVALGTGQYERLTKEDKVKKRKGRSTAHRGRSVKVASRRSSKSRE
ncbi:MAG: transglycosylase SLT domain-containing protein [Silvanigrellaceae bacterium]